MTNPARTRLSDWAGNAWGVRAELVCMRLFDVGGEVDFRRVTQLAGAPPTRAPLEPQSPHPYPAGFPNPLEVVKPCPQLGPGGQMELRLQAIGVFTIRYRVTVEGHDLTDLQQRLQALRIDGQSVDVAAAEVAAGLRQDLAAALREPYPAIVSPERYDVYCLHLAPKDVPKMLAKEAEAIAQLVSDAREQPLIGARRAAASKHIMQYSAGDAVVLGWDHAVILDEPGQYEDVLDVMELANAELLEFRTYDAYLDERLEASFDALDRLWKPGGLFRSARTALQDISRLRVEFARLTDNLHDTGKVYGDWYMAQVLQRLHERFHLASWERAVATKMSTLEDMFHLAQEESNHRRSLVLEAAIVLLFVLDLIILLKVGA